MGINLTNCYRNNIEQEDLGNIVETVESIPKKKKTKSVTKMIENAKLNSQYPSLNVNYNTHINIINREQDKTEDNASSVDSKDSKKEIERF